MQRNQSQAVAHLFTGGSAPMRLRKGHSVTVRLATDDDAGALAAMHARCSADSVYRRYRSIPSMTGRFLSRLLNTDTALVAEIPNWSVVALANLGRDDDGSGELAVLVEDPWQGQGLGTAMLRHLITMARLTGYSEVYAACLQDPGWAKRVLSRLGPVYADSTGDHELLRLALHTPDVIGRRNVPDLVPAQ
jgi:GNAT superfamily N-acetyltransferase